MGENTQLPKEVVREINEQADKYGFVVPYNGSNKFYNDDKLEGYKAGATAYAAKLHQANETIKVLTYDNNRLKGEVEGNKSAVDELQTKYDNILAAESGHESKTENVWQSGYAAGHEAGCERGKREAQPGAVWVKASERLPMEAGPITWRWLDKEAAYSGFDGTAFIYDKGGARVDMLYAIEIEWYDESAAGREENACDFAEWMRLNCKSSQNGWVDALGKWDTTKGWYELFKQQKEK